jgi:hypothetical protein
MGPAINCLCTAGADSKWRSRAKEEHCYVNWERRLSLHGRRRARSATSPYVCHVRDEHVVLCIGFLYPELKISAYGSFVQPDQIPMIYSSSVMSAALLSTAPKKKASTILHSHMGLCHRLMFKNCLEICT